MSATSPPRSCCYRDWDGQSSEMAAGPLLVPVLIRCPDGAGHWTARRRQRVRGVVRVRTGRSASTARPPVVAGRCLTGVDYFSTLGYQPGIAALAAGLLRPVATLVLVALTLLGALPVYWRVAGRARTARGPSPCSSACSPGGRASCFVLVLLGFVATDFLITMTLSAADATAHLLENPLRPALLTGTRRGHAGAAGRCWRRCSSGFSEAIGIAVVLVAVYLALNAVVVGVGLAHVATRPALADWTDRADRRARQPLGDDRRRPAGVPQTGARLSGFETGVAVMPQIEGGPQRHRGRPGGRVRNTRKLLTTAALIMSVLPGRQQLRHHAADPGRRVPAGGQARTAGPWRTWPTRPGRLVRHGLRPSTILILWFAGAWAMAGLLNVVPRYLPRYGMAPEWARAARPLVLVFTVVAFARHLVLRRRRGRPGRGLRDRGAGADDLGAIAVTLSARRRVAPGGVLAFGLIALVFAVHHGGQHGRAARRGEDRRPVHRRPSSWSRCSPGPMRAFQLRARGITFDERRPTSFLHGAVQMRGRLRLVANEPGARDAEEYRDKTSAKCAWTTGPAWKWAPLIFIEVACDRRLRFRD